MILLLTVAAFLASAIGAALALALGSAWPLLWGYVLGVASPVPVIVWTLARARLSTETRPAFRMLTNSH